MSYNFTDDPTPALTTTINAVGDVVLVNGSPQSELITSAYGGSSVTVSIVPPSGWTLSSQTWTPSGPTLTVPPSGQEDTYSFTYSVSQGTAKKAGAGVFTLKKNGT